MRRGILSAPWRAADVWERGDNVLQHIRAIEGLGHNTEDAVRISYDLQAGTYVTNAARADCARALDTFAGAVARELDALGPCGSLLDVGVGEATSLVPLLRKWTPGPALIHGCDLSWSRLSVARSYCEEGGVSERVTLTMAPMSALPYADGSFDTVVTMHSLEPNGGRERELIAELHRVASRWLVLFEPDYEGATESARARMREHGYCRGLADHSRALGFDVRVSRPLVPAISETNPTAVTIIAKNALAGPAAPVFVCPRLGAPLVRLEDCFYCPESLLAYPVLGGIPCLGADHGILASRLSKRLAETPMATAGGCRL
jgi:SAM-dependent methyltransferase